MNRKKQTKRDIIQNISSNKEIRKSFENETNPRKVK